MRRVEHARYNRDNKIICKQFDLCHSEPDYYTKIREEGKSISGMNGSDLPVARHTVPPACPLVIILVGKPGSDRGSGIPIGVHKGVSGLNGTGVPCY